MRWRFAQQRVVDWILEPPQLLRRDRQRVGADRVLGAAPGGDPLAAVHLAVDTNPEALQHPVVRLVL